MSDKAPQCPECDEAMTLIYHADDIDTLRLTGFYCHDCREWADLKHDERYVIDLKTGLKHYLNGH